MNEHEIHLLQEGLDALLGNVRRTQSSLTKPSAILYIIYIESLSITITSLMVSQFQAWSIFETLGFASIRVSNLINMYRI